MQQSQGLVPQTQENQDQQQVPPLTIDANPVGAYGYGGDPSQQQHQSFEQQQIPVVGEQPQSLSVGAGQEPKRETVDWKDIRGTPLGEDVVGGDYQFHQQQLELEQSHQPHHLPNSAGNDFSNSIVGRSEGSIQGNNLNAATETQQSNPGALSGEVSNPDVGASGVAPIPPEGIQTQSNQDLYAPGGAAPAGEQVPPEAVSSSALIVEGVAGDQLPPAEGTAGDQVTPVEGPVAPVEGVDEQGFDLFAPVQQG
jgi:hypothetical protein